jgi:predicted RNA binding protein YcfA (HicA-like mRNA interferase family)
MPADDMGRGRAEAQGSWLSGEQRTGKGSHRLFKHTKSGKEIWVALHTKKDAGQLGNRILREAGIQ